APQIASPSSWTFTTLDNQNDPTFNQLLGISNAGIIVGYFGSGATGHPNKGYRLVSPYGQTNYRNENFPGSAQTQVVAINNRHDTAGFWVDGNGNNFGFIRWNGVSTSYRNPHTGTGTVNQLLGLNDRGIAVGFYTDGQGTNHGYAVNQATGRFQAIVPPGGGSVIATGINDNNDVTGIVTSGSTTAGFLMKNGAFSEFDFPASTNTTPFGINKSDQIVGAYVDGTGNTHGFLLSNPLRHARWQSIDDPNGVGTTLINGINDNDDLVGFYGNCGQSAPSCHGFLATP
ncbi:MAG: hypothetical protein ABI346_07550, partial [Candidatus Baltobacteraceae bacterium]